MKAGVISVISAACGIALGAVSAGKAFEREIINEQKMSNKHLALFKMMNQWVRIKQENKSIASYLEAKGYRRIAVYGLSFAGGTLVEELKESNVVVAYGIDKNANNIYSDIDVFLAEDELLEVDAVVVTAITFFEEIEKILSAKLGCPIISLEDILYEI